MKTLVVHFGGGALGRGLVVPILDQSDCDVVLVDVDDKLLAQINERKGYPVYVSDEIANLQHQFIAVKDTVSSINEPEKLREYVNEASIITTSVRRENLIHVVNNLINNIDGGKEKLVICAENIENVSDYFKELLEEAVQTKEQAKAAQSLIVPNTIVDRICSSDWPNSLQVNTEKFAELAVDKAVAVSTGIRLIAAVDDIEAAFARKRLMVNTYADASSFMALAEGKTYLHEALLDDEIQDQLAPYFDSFKLLLEKKYHYSRQELDDWQLLYKKRLSNPKIKRELTSVARNLWAKMTLKERFVWPLLELMDLNGEIEGSVKVLIEMIKKSSNESEKEIQQKLANLWDDDPKGHKLYQIALNYL